jgi:hypothetical protein
VTERHESIARVSEKIIKTTPNDKDFHTTGKQGTIAGEEEGWLTISCQQANDVITTLLRAEMKGTQNALYLVRFQRFQNSSSSGVLRE